MDDLMPLRFRTHPVPMRSLAEVMANAEGDLAIYRSGGRTIAHVGRSTAAVAHGANRAMDILAATKATRIVHETEAPIHVGPTWLGGMAFDADHAGTGVWMGFPAADFSLPHEQWWWEGDALYRTQCDGPAMATTAAPPGHLVATTDSQWAEQVEHICLAINAGTVTKTVLARTATETPSDALQAFIHLLDINDGIGFFFRRGATFYGVTPERLIVLDDRQIATHALAGSTPRLADATADAAGAAELAASGKDLLEHELVVAFVRERLVEAGVTGVHQKPRRVRGLRHVQHLETLIHGTSPPHAHILEIAHVLHPTPAVCGTPRQQSLQLIRRLEGFARGWYAGAVGWFSPDGQGELAVALRCALQTDDTRYCFAGAGIVAGSNVRAEWQETEAKLASIREAR